MNWHAKAERKCTHDEKQAHAHNAIYDEQIEKRRHLEPRRREHGYVHNNYPKSGQST